MDFKKLIIVLAFGLTVAVRAQSNLTFSQTISEHFELNSKITFDSTIAYTSTIWFAKSVNSSKTTYYLADTFVVPNGKTWKIEYAKVVHNGGSLALAFNSSGSSGNINFTPSVGIKINGVPWKYGSDVEFSNVLWLKEGDTIIAEFDNRKLYQAYGYWYDTRKSPIYWSADFHLSALEFSVQ